MYEVRYNGRMYVVWAIISTVVFDEKDCYMMLIVECDRLCFLYIIVITRDRPNCMLCFVNDLNLYTLIIRFGPSRWTIVRCLTPAVWCTGTVACKHLRDVTSSPAHAAVHRNAAIFELLTIFCFRNNFMTIDDTSNCSRAIVMTNEHTHTHTDKQTLYWKQPISLRTLSVHGW